MQRSSTLCGDLPDIQNIIKEYSIGLCFNEKDPADIAWVLNMVCADEGLMRGLKKATQRAARDLCWENESIKYLRFVDDVLKT